MSEYILEIQDLKKSFPRGFWGKPSIVLNSVSFKVRQGVTTGFIGVNGSGKTTSFKTILDFIRPDSGSITYFGGQNFTNQVRAQIGFLPERPYFQEFLTLREFLNFHWKLNLEAQNSDLSFDIEIKRVLEIVNLERAIDWKLQSFSKGMLQRAGIAQALLGRPKFLIFDEPMSGLDPDGRMMVKDIIKDQQKSGTSILFSTHLLSDVEELCQDLVVIDAGKIIYQGELGSFISSVNESFRIVYEFENTVRTDRCSKAELNNKVMKLIESGAVLKKVDSEHGLVDSAFLNLRGKMQIGADR